MDTSISERIRPQADSGCVRPDDEPESTTVLPSSTPRETVDTNTQHSARSSSSIVRVRVIRIRSLRAAPGESSKLTNRPPTRLLQMEEHTVRGQHSDIGVLSEKYHEKKKYDDQPPDELTFVYMSLTDVSLADLIHSHCFRDPVQARYLTSRMLHDMSSALCYLRSLKPRLIYCTVRPEFILYRDRKFLLADMHLAKSASDMYTEMAAGDVFPVPEPLGVQGAGASSSNADIYTLGMTVVACLTSSSAFQMQWLSGGSLDAWRSIAESILRGELANFAPSIKRMLARDPNDRPDPSLLLRELEAYIGNDGQSDCWPTPDGIAAAGEVRVSRDGSVAGADAPLEQVLSEIMDLSEPGNQPQNVPPCMTGTGSVPNTLPSSATTRSFYSARSVQSDAEQYLPPLPTDDHDSDSGEGSEATVEEASMWMGAIYNEPGPVASEQL